jgi:hypothetical protein
VTTKINAEIDRIVTECEVWCTFPCAASPESAALVKLNAIGETLANVKRVYAALSGSYKLLELHCDRVKEELGDLQANYDDLQRAYDDAIGRLEALGE